VLFGTGFEVVVNMVEFVVSVGNEVGEFGVERGGASA